MTEVRNERNFPRELREGAEWLKETSVGSHIAESALAAAAEIERLQAEADYGDGYRAAIVGRPEDPSAAEAWRKGWSEGWKVLSRIKSGDFEEPADDREG